EGRDHPFDQGAVFLFPALEIEHGMEMEGDLDAFVGYGAGGGQAAIQGSGLMLLVGDYDLRIQGPGAAYVRGNIVLEYPPHIGGLGLEFQNGVRMRAGEAAKIRQDVVLVAP